jgi:hypothetical protein
VFAIVRLLCCRVREKPIGSPAPDIMDVAVNLQDKLDLSDSDSDCQ